MAETQQNARGTGGSFAASVRANFHMTDSKGQMALASAILFLLTPILAIFVSELFFLLLIPAILLSIGGLSGSKERGAGAGRLGATGLVMTVNGIALIVALFVVGFVQDFFLTGTRPHETSGVALGYTTVHMMLGVGLLLYDNYRHARSD